MKWGGPIFLGSALVLTLSSGTLVKKAGSKQSGGGGDGPLYSKSSGGASMSAPGAGTPGLTPGSGSNLPPGSPLSGPGGTAGQGINREWRGYVPTDVEALRAQLPPQAQHLAEAFVSAGQTYGIDPLFLMSISKLETGTWTSNAFRNRGNAMGISNAAGVINQGSHAASIDLAARSLAGGAGTSNYYAGANTVGQVGAIYAPSGAANDVNGTNSHWAGYVGNFYDGFAGSIRGGN
jgi:hypothetical protein